jgi:hypothetical protein
MSLKRFELRNTFARCPVYWQNFITHLQNENDMWNRDVSIPIIQRELKPYNGRYRMAGSEPWDYIEFDTEQQFTLFVLRWS